VHLLIGVGEGVITGLTVASVLAVRPDLVRGARHLVRSSELTVRPTAGLALDSSGR
jgi:cobalt/nickel transport system permease protein